MVTLYHWDLPQPLQDKGGWLNESMADYFKDFARVAYENFGDRVDKWLTFNEPWIFCVLGYGNTLLAPAVAEPLDSHYTCVHNVLKAHASAYHLYKTEFQEKQCGQCGIALDSNFFQQADVMRQLVDAKSKEQGFPTSRLPTFDYYWKEKINGSLDFLGLNHYSTELIKPTIGTTPDWWGDQNVVSSQDPSWEDSGTIRPIVPWGFRKLLKWIKITYGNPPLYVTENGYGDAQNGGLDDQTRIRYHTSYINEMLKAANIDGCNVKPYTVWSLLDNFEWSFGYTARFGVNWVNFTDPHRPRLPKASVETIKKIIRDNGFPNE